MQTDEEEAYNMFYTRSPKRPQTHSNPLINDLSILNSQEILTAS